MSPSENDARNQRDRSARRAPGRRPARFTIYMLLGALAASMYAGDVDLGPFSLRVYLYVALAGWMAARCILEGEPIVRDGRALSLLFLYVAFIVWSMVALALQHEPVSLIVAKAINYHALAGLTAVLTLFFVRTRADVGLFVRGLIVILLVSCVIGILQALSVPQAWALWRALRPQIEGVIDQPGVIFAADGIKRLSPPGLFATSAGFGYWVSAVAPLIFRRFLARKSLATSVTLALGIAGLIMVQQRASLLAVVVCCGLLVMPRLRERGRRLNTIALVIVLVSLLAGVVVLAARSETTNTSMNRYFELTDVGRAQVAMIAWNFFLEHPFIGGVSDYMQFYEEGYQGQTRYKAITPHNMFMNAAVYYGLAGLLLLCAFLACLITIMYRIWTVARDRRDWTSMTLVASLCGYLISAQFHNASFVTGDILPWALISAMLSSSRSSQGRTTSALARSDRNGILRDHDSVTE